MPPIAVTTFHQPTNAPPRAVVASLYTPGDGVIHLTPGHAARFTALPCIVSCLESPGDSNSAVLSHLKITGANTGANTITVEAPTDGYTDVSLPAGTVVDIRVIAELTTEIHTAVNAIESFLNAGAALYACRFVLGSPATTGSDVVPWLQLPAAGTIRKATITAKTEPVGADLVVDIKYSTNNGSTWTSIWTLSGDRLTLTAGNHTGSTTTFGHASLAAGNLLRLDTIQVGSTTPGSDVVIDLWIVFPSPP